jgi:hypothetical protein
MNLPSDWPVLVLAAGAAVLAIDAGADLTVAVPAGIAAVALAALLLVTSVGEVSWRGAPTPPVEPPTTTSSLRAAFRSGRSGRISIVLEVDRLERHGLHPQLPTRNAAEEERIRRMPRAEFREYLAARLDQIEAGDA